MDQALIEYERRNSRLLDTIARLRKENEAVSSSSKRSGEEIWLTPENSFISCKLEVKIQACAPLSGRETLRQRYLPASKTATWSSEIAEGSLPFAPCHDLRKHLKEGAVVQFLRVDTRYCP